MLVRGIFIFACVLGLGLVTQKMSTNPGDVVIVWQGYDVRFSTTVLCVALAVGLGAFFLAGYIFSWLSLFPKLIRAKRGRKHEAKGLNYLFEAFEALSLGDAKEAQKAAHKSRHLLTDTRLSRVVEAQALSHQGKTDKAEALYLDLSSEKKSQLAGLRGLLAQSIKEKNWHEAELLLESCQEEYPKNGWVVKQAMLVYLHQGHFYKAQDYLKTYLAYADVSADEKQTTLFALALLKPEGAHKAIEQLHKKYGLTLPTALYQLETLVSQQKWRPAFKLASQLWEKCPHNMTYALWVALLNKRFKKPDYVKQTLLLVSAAPEKPASRLAVAAAHIKTGNALKARQVLTDMLAEYDYREVYDLLVEAERMLNPHSKDIARWIEKAMNASPAPHTYLDASHHIYDWLNHYAAPIDMDAFSMSEMLKNLGGETVFEPDDVQEIVVA